MEVGANVAGTLVEEESGHDVSAEVVDDVTADAAAAGVELTGYVE